MSQQSETDQDFPPVDPFCDIVLFNTVHTLCLAAAAVLDTVLLLAVLERRNRAYVQTPVVLLILGGTLWHLGAFCYTLLSATGHDWAAGALWFAMLVMSSGLLLMPSAMLHGVWRTYRTGLSVLTRPQPRYLLAYLPLLALVPVGLRLARFEAAVPFVDRLWPFVPAYTVWLFGVNLLAAVGFRQLATNAETVAAKHFFSRMALVLVGLIVLHAAIFLLAIPVWPEQRPVWLLMVMLSPVAPALVFSYYVLRYDFTSIVVERSLVYAAIVAGGLVLHELAVRPVTSQLSGRFGLNFALIEGLLVLGLVLLYSPLRQRTAEALRYLMGERIAPMRESTRSMAVAMSEYSTGSPQELLAWFCSTLQEALSVRWTGVWLFEGIVPAISVSGEPRLPDSSARDLLALLQSEASSALTPRNAPSRGALDQLRVAGTSLVIRLRHREIEGLLALGRSRGNRDLTDEEVSAAVLLAEQLTVTLHAGLVQADRLAAERRAMQNEKLGTLGLVASSIAHEVKNPLSSIRTIATLLAEEMSADDPKRQDVTIIRDEIDRLAATTSRLLKFARPANSNGHAATPVSAAETLAATIHLLGYLARQKKVALASNVAEDLSNVAADEDALREIFANLIANAVEAARSSVEVTAISSDGRVRVEIADDGPGISPAVRERLFEPFVTTRAEGTGLGLYIVSRRVRELGGSIRCETPADGGTRFVVELPGAAPPRLK